MGGKVIFPSHDRPENGPEGGKTAWHQKLIKPGGLVFGLETSIINREISIDFVRFYHRGKKTDFLLETRSSL